MPAHIIKPNLQIQEGDKLIYGREVLHINQVSRNHDLLILDVTEGKKLSLESYGLSAVVV